MITKAQVKEIRALATAKGRAEWGAFIAEGDKLAREWLASGARLRYVAGLPVWLQCVKDLLRNHPEAQAVEVTEEELVRISTQQSPNSVLIVAELPAPPAQLPHAAWTIVLDDVQDPGNVGAIIRIADWFGIGHVVASPACADFYNPKVVSAAMGGHLRVQLHTASLPEFLPVCGMPVFAATLGGQPAATMEQPTAAALIIGNESKGISAGVLALANNAITIPRRGGAESLNAAVSAGILVSMLLPG